MAEPGSRAPASQGSAYRNWQDILQEYGWQDRPSEEDAAVTTARLRKALQRSGLKGFKKGGRVPHTGVYKLHKGELVVPKGKARLALDKVFP